MEKALELIGALDHDETFRLCFFWQEEIKIVMWGRCFAFKVNTYQIRQYIRLPSIVVTCKLAQRCDRHRAERNYTRCKYQHMYLQLERLNK